jgi:hypothetical protein
VAEVPDRLVLKKHRDLDGVAWYIWVRRALFGLACVLPVVALFNVFGQRPESHTASAAGATLKVYAPSTLRGGLLYQARFTVHAISELKKATLVLDTGWAESTTINTIEPSPVSEASANGKLSFELGHVPAGQNFILYMDFQMNPTNIGHRSAGVSLYDGDTKLLHVSRAVTIFP